MGAEALFAAQPDDAPKPSRTRPNFASELKRKAALELFREGLGYKRAAAKLGLPVNTVRDWARAWRRGRFHVRLNANQYRYTAQTKLDVLSMRRRGASWREIVAATGVPCSTCRYWCARLEAEPAEAAKLYAARAAERRKRGAR